MDKLAELAASVTGYAAKTALMLVPAVPDGALGPEVCLGPDSMGLPGFLAMAHEHGGGLLYLHAAPFDPVDDEHEIAEPPRHLVQRKGQIRRIDVAFAANGIVHLWTHQADWYLEWQSIADEQSSRSASITNNEDDQFSDEEQEQIITTLLANSEFRAAKGSARQRVVRLVVPKLDDWGFWSVIRDACDRADELASQQYKQLTDRLDELADELVANPQYQQISSASARRQFAGEFLITKAEGFSAPAPVRDELHARAQHLARAKAARLP
ncbi:hypothetical protein [Microtetraspora fusca]|uniref:hypothetical protein n=1 Tax=Microtetraspora fusca TaxID=1997 RepID=UPI00082CD91F|nr:hypothetical protein [Microtetraspora fusca]